MAKFTDLPLSEQRRLIKESPNTSLSDIISAYDKENAPQSTGPSLTTTLPFSLENAYKSGGKIYIKPENRGKFTALKKRTGHSASWFKAHGTPAQKKMAVFALNARKWKHADGGNLFDAGGDTDETPAEILARLRNQSSQERRQALISAITPQDQAFAVRNTTMTPSSQSIGMQRETHNAITPRDVTLDEGPMGFMPIIGDALQAGQAVKDFSEGNYGRAALGAGLLVMPNVLEKPMKAAAKLVTDKIKDLGGGYMLKSLMRGNPLEKQIGKEGTINVNNVRAYANKGSKVEKAVIDKVLDSENFAGKKAVDYNDFRKAVQDELITYNRVPDKRWEDYGTTALGIATDEETLKREAYAAAQDGFLAAHPDLPWVRRGGRFYREDVLPDGSVEHILMPNSYPDLIHPGWEKEFTPSNLGVPKMETFTFSSPRIPDGSGEHYDKNTLGHSRTYTTTDEPDVLHVMESQSDWAQSGGGNRNGILPKEYWDDLIKGKKEKLRQLERSPEPETEQFGWEAFERDAEISKLREEILDAEIRKANSTVSYQAQLPYLADNYTSRQIQENLRYAAEKGQTKMRYPTRETAAKIEGYPSKEVYYREDNTLAFVDDPKSQSDYVRKKYAHDLYSGYMKELLEKNNGVPSVGSKDYDRFIYLYSELRKNDYSKYGNIIKKKEYEPEYETILRKYDAFPKQYKKLYKDADIRTVADPKGNTWYEVDVPENYLGQEWAYAGGGPINIFRKLMAPTYDTSSFSEAFGQARRDGKSYFKWNGKRYNTKLNTETFKESNPFNYEEGYSLIDAARRIKEVENSKNNPRGGYDAGTDRWYPHRSHEGGADTIAYGIKLSNGTPEAELARRQGYLTDTQANEAIDTLVRTYGDSAERVYNKKFGEGAWDDLSEKSKSILIDYEYNPGLSKFPNLMTGFHDADLEKIKANYKRYSRGKELGRNKTLARDIDSLSTFYPILGK